MHFLDLRAHLPALGLHRKNGRVLSIHVRILVVHDAANKELAVAQLADGAAFELLATLIARALWKWSRLFGAASTGAHSAELAQYLFGLALEPRLARTTLLYVLGFTSGS